MKFDVTLTHVGNPLFNKGGRQLCANWKAVEVVVVLALKVLVPGNAPLVVTLVFGVASVLVVLGMHGADVVFISSCSSLGKYDALPTAALACFFLFGVASVLVVPGMHGADVVLISSHSSLGKSDALPAAALAGFLLLVDGDGHALCKSWFLSVSSFNTLGLSL